VAEVGKVDDLYRDQWITCTADAVLIKGYYFPWGAKRVPYGAIREVRRVPIGTLTGRGCIWGSTTLRYWASLDPGRPAKETALILDTGSWILPFITPDDPAKVAAVISERAGVAIVDSEPVIA
jgi:hypothetical protein